MLGGGSKGGLVSGEEGGAEAVLLGGGQVTADVRAHVQHIGRLDPTGVECVECGLCVEACPCDAIRMDTGMLPMPAFHRSAFVYDKARLLSHEPAQPGGYRPGIGGGK